ncbi:uncharacterized protein [Montipora capricornis]|uniref:uncharacterized protein n=1 Tax=Montipora capricornis TaxID=246305 RepID=UPI0035F1961E
MLFLCALLLPFLSSCLSEVVWDPTDPRCEQRRNEANVREYWDDSVMGQAYSWIDRYGHTSYYDVRSVYYRLVKDLLKKGCDEYEKVKKTDDYRCWSKEFLCSAKEVTKITVDSHDMKTGYVHQRWYGWFEAPGRRHPSYVRDEEINWITKMRWNDPRLLYWAKSDLEELGNNMFDRIFYYIDKNNINSLQLVFDHYKSSGIMDFMREQCESMNRDDTKMQCKLAIVFDRLAELMVDHMDIPWDMNHPPPRNREELSMLYLLQPKVFVIMNIASKARNKTLCDRLMTMFQSLYDNALNQDGNRIKNHFGKFGSIYANMKRDCADTYQNDFEQLTCYLAETFARMDALGSALGPDYDNWQSRRSQSMRAVVLVWLLLTPKGNFYVKTDALKRAESAKELLKIMYDKIQENDLTGLQDIANLIPNENQMGLTSGDECAPNFDKISKSMKCGFKIVMENLAVFLDQYSVKDRRTKSLDVSVDHKTRLTQFQISSIKGAVENTKLELQSSLEKFTGEIKKYFEASIGNRFTSLRNYFRQVSSFDGEIAKADTIFITGKLKEFKKTAADLQQKLDYDTSKLQVEGTAIKTIGATFMWLKAAGSGISAVIGIMGGDFGGFADTADRIDAAAKATLEAVKGSKIHPQIKKANDSFQKIAEGFQKNQVHLENTKKIIDKLEAEETSADEFKTIQDDFLKSYNDYTPQVSEAQIAELDAAWNEVVENLETLVDSVETKEAIAAATYIFVGNHLFKLKIAVPQLAQTLSNRYDYQFDLMDSLTATLRAHTSMQAANGLTKGFEDLEWQLAESAEAQLALEQMALSTYVISQFHLLLILSQYCNYVTYVNAGVESYQCTNALRTMDTNHIDEALSYNPPSCDVVKVDLKIPTSDSGKADSINLNLLNSGESVTFQIPNFEWLKLNGEVSSNDQDSALFVKLFEIYAITNDNYELRNNLRVEITPTGSAPIYAAPGQIKYELRPRSRTQYVFEYKENYRGNCDSEKNPYLVCSPGPKGICVQSRGELNNKLGAYPSVYSAWIIKLDQKIDNAPKPAQQTKLYLQAKLQLCRKRKDANIRSSRGRKRSFKSTKKHKHYAYRDSDVPACPAGKYFNQESGLFAACSADSTPQHYGYYCELNPSE